MKKQLTLSEKLKRYSLLTAGTLASAAAADAQVVYTDVNPDYTGYGSYYGDVFSIDLNNDGITDFTIIAMSYSGGDSNIYWSSNSVVAEPQYGNSVAVLSSLPEAIDSGIAIGTNLVWGNDNEQMLRFRYRWQDRSYWSSTGVTSFGNFLNQSEKFLGVRFSFGGEQYYGWIRLSVSSGAYDFTIYDFAYDASANTPITAGDIGCPTFYADDDNDFFGNTNDAGAVFCYNPGAGYSTKNSDCDDSNAMVNPAQDELCNNVDDNCNGSIDENVLIKYFADADGDGYGDVNNYVSSCAFPIGYVIDSTDCDDTSPSVHPTGAPIQWQKSLGGSGTDVSLSIQQTYDGGFVVAGYSYSNDGDVSGNHGSYDYWIVKLDTSGNIEWQKSLGGSDIDYGYSIQQTSEGGFVVAGLSYSNDGDVSGNHGNYSPDYWIVKLDTLGNIEWQKSLGSIYIDFANSIQQTADGGFVVAGFTAGDNGDVSGFHGSSDYWIVKLDTLGNIEWQKCLGGISYENATSIQQTGDGGFVVAGQTLSINGDVSGNHGIGDCWIVKLDTSGNIEWQKCLGGSDWDGASSIRQTTDGGFVMAGSTSSTDGDVSGNHGGGDCWIVKLDTLGNIEWQKCLGGSGGDGASSIWQTTDGGFVVAGGTSSIDGDVSGNHGGGDCWIVKLDTLGNIEWQKSLGGTNDDAAYSIQQTSGGGFMVAGYSRSNDGDVSGNHGDADYWIVKLAPTGIEICNGVDDNCNGSTDEGLLTTYYSDNDGDNYGDANNSVSSCSPVTGYVTDNTDCDDNNSSANPSATEICNNVDDNCNGSIDDGLIFTTYYADADGDNYGDANNSVSSCAPVSGYVIDNTDCDDSNSEVNPSATEVCNNVDDNCNGSIDDGLVFTTYYADADGDNYGDTSNSVSSCTPVSGYVTDNTDCDDNNSAVNPSASEICNNIDDNCNGATDDGLSFVTYYADVDGDNYGDANNSTLACTLPNGYVTDNTDCDDNNAAVNPSATEVCNNIDDNCNGSIDDGLVFTIYYADADGDTYGDTNNSVSNCDLVEGYILDNTDCDDNNPNVNPGALEMPNNGIDDNCNGDIDEFGVGISSIADYGSSLSVFPNPTDCNFSIELKLNDEVTAEGIIEVLNMLGQKMISEKVQMVKGVLQKEIQLSDEADGMYLVKVIINDQVFSSQINYQK